MSLKNGCTLLMRILRVSNRLCNFVYSYEYIYTQRVYIASSKYFSRGFHQTNAHYTSYYISLIFTSQIVFLFLLSTHVLSVFHRRNMDIFYLQSICTLPAVFWSYHSLFFGYFFVALLITVSEIFIPVALLTVSHYFKSQLLRFG